MKIVEHTLSATKVDIFMRSRLQDGLSLSRNLLGSVDFTKGKASTFLPESISQESLHDFEFGGKIPFEGEPFYVANQSGGQDRIQPAINCDMQLIGLLNKFLKTQGDNVCVFEDFNMENTSDWIESWKKKSKSKLLILNEKVYHLLTADNAGHGEVKSVISAADSTWHFVGILTKTTRNFKDQVIEINPTDMDMLCHNLIGIVLGAYDGESFIFWTP